MCEVRSATALGGNMYIVEFKPSTLDELLFGGKGKIVHVHARSREEAIKKALIIARRRGWR